MGLIIPFIIILVLILLNGMFVAAEFAIIGVRPTRIKQLADEGNGTAKRLHHILNDRLKTDRYIASAQLGITLASLGLGMYAEPVIAHVIESPLHHWFGLEGDIVHTISFFTALTIITYFHVVIGEMVPKSLALQNSERTVFLLASPMFIMQTLFAYPIKILNEIGMVILAILRIPPPASTSRLTTPNELELIISDSVVGGLVEHTNQAIISGIFDFGDLTVGQIMIPRPKIEALPHSITEAKLLKRVMNSPHTRLPVYQENIDHIIGIVHLKDIVEQQLEGHKFDLQAMLHEAPFIPETASAKALLSIFKQKHVHMAVVIDEYGGTAGIVTFEDLMEEIVGEVRDEFDIHEKDRIVIIKPGHIIAQGTVRLDEISDYVDLGDADKYEAIDTLGGLMISRLSLPALIGDELNLDNNITLRIEEVDGLAIERVAIHFPVDGNSDPTSATQ